MKKIIVLLVLMCSIFGCENTPVSEVKLQNNSKQELIELKQKTMISILTIAKRKDFKEFVLKECLKQEHGDYNVYLSKIIAVYSEKEGYKEFAN
jgi:hypothetical protein